MLRIDGTLRRVTHEPLTEQHVDALLRECLSDEQCDRLAEEGSLECAHQLPSGERLRISAHVVTAGQLRNPGRIGIRPVIRGRIQNFLNGADPLPRAIVPVKGL